MTDLLAGILAALISTNAPNATNNAGRPANASFSVANPNDPIEIELHEVLADDDAAVDDVAAWTDAANTSSAAGDSSAQSTLHFRVNQRLDRVKGRYQDFLVHHPGYTRALLAYGSFLNQTGDTVGARVQWEKALQLAPENPAVWDDLGTLYEKGSSDEDIKKSFEYFAKALHLDPTQAVYYHNLAADVYLFRKDAAEYWKISDQDVYDMVLALYQKAIQLAPDDFILASDYAECFYGIDPPRWNDALEAWGRCLKIARTEVEREGVDIHLARAHLALAKFDDARRDLDAVTNTMYLTFKDEISLKMQSATGNAPTGGAPKPSR